MFYFLYLHKLTSPEQLFRHSGWQCRHSLGPLVYTPGTASQRLTHCRPSRKFRHETHWSSSGPQHPSSEHSGEQTSLSASVTTATICNHHFNDLIFSFTITYKLSIYDMHGTQLCTHIRCNVCSSSMLSIIYSQLVHVIFT